VCEKHALFFTPVVPKEKGFWWLHGGWLHSSFHYLCGRRFLLAV
jgi:hypothetical protein